MLNTFHMCNVVSRKILHTCRYRCAETQILQSRATLQDLENKLLGKPLSPQRLGDENRVQDIHGEGVTGTVWKMM